jgi:2Fe-2S ferredoxin
MLSRAALRRSVVNVRFTGKGVDRTVLGKAGESLLFLAERNGIHIPSACEGSGACATCQLYVTRGMDLLRAITDQENDTLDFAVASRAESRLACRAVITASEGDIEVSIPLQSRNII